MTLDEPPERIQLSLQRHHGIHLRQPGRHDPFLPRTINVDVQRILERDFGELRELFRVRRAEEHGLSVLRVGHVRDDGLHRGKEPHIQESIRLIQNEDFNPVRLEPDGAVKVLKDSSGRGDDDVHPGHTGTFVVQWFPANDHSGGKGVVSTELAERFKRLDGEFSCRGKDECAQAVLWAPAVAVESFERRDEKGEGFTGAGTGGGLDVLAFDGGGDGECLDGRRFGKVG